MHHMITSLLFFWYTIMSIIYQIIQYRKTCNKKSKKLILIIYIPKNTKQLLSISYGTLSQFYLTFNTLYSLNQIMFKCCLLLIKALADWQACSIFLSKSFFLTNIKMCLVFIPKPVWHCCIYQGCIDMKNHIILFLNHSQNI